MHDRVRKHVIRCTKKTRFLILEALSTSFDCFSIQTCENKIFFTRESLLTTRDQLFMTRNITSIPLCVRSLLEFYLLLIVAKLFSLNEDFGHVHKYEASLWTLENWEKYLFCYKMIIFNVTVLKISENMYIIDI